MPRGPRRRNGTARYSRQAQPPCRLGGNGPRGDTGIDGTIVRVSAVGSSEGAEKTTRRPFSGDRERTAPNGGWREGAPQATDSQRRLRSRQPTLARPVLQRRLPTAARRSPGSATRPCRGSSPGARPGRSRRSSGRDARGCCSRGGARWCRLRRRCASWWRRRRSP